MKCGGGGSRILGIPSDHTVEVKAEVEVDSFAH